MRELPVTTTTTSKDTTANHVFFDGKPSQIINLPYLLGGIVVLIALEIAYVFASQHWRMTPVVAFVPAALIEMRVKPPHSWGGRIARMPKASNQGLVWRLLLLDVLPYNSNRCTAATPGEV